MLLKPFNSCQEPVTLETAQPRKLFFLFTSNVFDHITLSLNCIGIIFTCNDVGRLYLTCNRKKKKFYSSIKFFLYIILLKIMSET